MDNTGLLPLTVNDFSGGKTDYILGGDPRQNEIIDNKVINENKDAVTRPGSKAKYNFRITSEEIISTIIDHDSEIILQAGTRVFSQTTTPSEILSPQGRSVFLKGGVDTLADTAFWNGHTLAVNGSFSSPQKIFRDESQNWRSVTLGLPEPIYAWAMALANELKYDWSVHLYDATAHTATDAAPFLLLPDASDLVSLIELTNALKASYVAHNLDASLASGWSYHKAQAGAQSVLKDTSDVTTLFTAYLMLSELKERMNSHADDLSSHDAAYTGDIGGSVVIAKSTPGNVLAGTSYIYAFYFVYRYQVGEIQYVERGKPFFLQIEDGSNPTSYSTLLQMTGLTSGEKESFDDANITVAIARTSNGGGVLYDVKEVPNTSAISFTDTLSDEELQLRPPSYFNGGVVDNDMPPPAKFIEVVNDTTFFAHLKEGSVVRANKLRASKPSQPYACPEDYDAEFEGDITAFGSANNYPIVFLKNKIYRIEGGFDSSGRGGLFKKLISDRIGSVSPKSLVRTKEGLFFAGEDGWYFTDAFQWKKISPDLNITFSRLHDKTKICGTYDGLTNRAIWGVKSDEASAHNDTLFVAHLDYSTPLSGLAFTTWSGGKDPDNFSASSLEFIGGKLYRADMRGYLLYHDQALTQDDYVDTLKDPDLWGNQTIHDKMVSVAFDFGNSQVRKWVPKLCVNANNETSLSLQVSASSDRSNVFSALKPISSLGNVEWGDPTSSFGDDGAPRWNYFPVVSQWRYLNASEQNLRCMYKQFKFENSYTTIDSSEAAGPCDINSTAKTLTLNNYPSSTWVPDAVNYYISFETDNYETEYLITDINASTLTIRDTSNTISDGTSVNWLIKGYKKREILHLIDYVINFKIMTMTQDTFRGSR
jgi:hypothetical protein